MDRALFPNGSGRTVACCLFVYRGRGGRQQKFQSVCVPRLRLDTHTAGAPVEGRESWKSFLREPRPRWEAAKVPKCVCTAAAVRYPQLKQDGAKMGTKNVTKFGAQVGVNRPSAFQQVY